MKYFPWQDRQKEAQYVESLHARISNLEADNDTLRLIVFLFILVALLSGLTIFNMLGGFQ